MLSQSTHIENFNKYPIWLLSGKSGGAVSMCTPFNKPKSGTLFMEIWKDVPGFEDYLQASNLGRIKTLDRIVNYKLPNGTLVKAKKCGKLRKLRIGTTGYCMVNVWVNSKHCLKRVHRLVALAFIPNPENKPHINHKDFNRLNNHIDNLEWVTAKENHHHARLDGRYMQGIGEESFGHKLTWKVVNDIRTSNLTPFQLSEKYNITRRNIYSILNYKTWNNAESKRL